MNPLDSPLLSARSSLASARGKRKSWAPRLTLAAVIGHTATTQFSHALSRHTGDIAYIAGNTVTIIHRRTNTSTTITGNASKSLACLSFSGDGSMIVVGESGDSPAITVYDTTTGERRASHTTIVDHNVRAVKFLDSGSGRSMIVAVGHQRNDKHTHTDNDSSNSHCQQCLAVYDWRTDSPTVHRTVADNVSGMDVSDDGSYVATCGDKFITFHYVTHADSDNGSVSLTTCGAKLGVHKSANFVSIVCGLARTAISTFALTRDGVLCSFTHKSKPSISTAVWDIEKWVDLRLELGYALCLVHCEGQEMIAAAGAEGKIRVFEPSALTHICTMPKPSPLATHTHANSSSASYPHTSGVLLSPDLCSVTAFYTDRSIIVWNIANPKTLRASHSLTGHSGCVWDMCETSGHSDAVPSHSLVTCAADSTLKLWQFDSDLLTKARRSRNNKHTHIHTDCQLSSTLLHDSDGSLSTGAKSLLTLPSHTDTVLVNDKKGKVLVYSLLTMTVIATIASPSQSQSVIGCMDYSDDRKLLVTATKDNLLHFFHLATADKPSHTQTLSVKDTVTAMRFAMSGNRLVSIHSDGSIVLRALSCDSYIESNRIDLKPGTVALDLVIHPSDRFFAIVTSDAMIRVYDLHTARETRSYAINSGSRTHSECLRLCLDSTGSLLAVSSSDRAIHVIEWFSGITLATLHGHGSLVTALRFIDGTKRLVSGSADGCLYQWKVDDRLSQALKNVSLKSARGQPSGVNTARRSRRSAIDYIDDSDDIESVVCVTENVNHDDEERTNGNGGGSELNSPILPARPSIVPQLNLPVASTNTNSVGEQDEKSAQPYKPSSNALPDWAKTRVPSTHTSTAESSSVSAPPLPSHPPNSRWVERASHGYRIASELGDSGLAITPNKSLQSQSQSEHRQLNNTFRADDPNNDAIDTESEIVEESKLMSWPPKSTVTREDEDSGSGELLEGASDSNNDDGDMQVIDLDQQSTSAEPTQKPVVSRPTSPKSSQTSSEQVSLPQVPAPASAKPLFSASAGSKRSSRNASRSGSRPTSPSQPKRALQSSAPLCSDAVVSEKTNIEEQSSAPVGSGAASASAQSANLTIVIPPPRSVAPVSSYQLAMQRLQHHFSHTLTLFDQLRQADDYGSSSMAASYERDLLQLYDRIGASLTDSRIKQLRTSDTHTSTNNLSVPLTASPMTASSFDRSSVDALTLDASLGGSGVVVQSLDRYSELLIDMVLRKLDGKKGETTTGSSIIHTQSVAVPLSPLSPRELARMDRIDLHDR